MSFATLICSMTFVIERKSSHRRGRRGFRRGRGGNRSEEHTSELQSPCNLVCRLLLEKKKTLVSDDAVDALHLQYIATNALDNLAHISCLLTAHTPGHPVAAALTIVELYRAPSTPSRF